MIDKRRPAAVLTLFVVTLFTGSALLFLVQPMFAKMVLPLLGGTPAVWATSMVFFQATLLAGYAYAHWSVGRLGIRRQALVHIPLVLLPLLLLPIGVPSGWEPPAQERPVFWLLWLLTFSLGLPFFVLSTSAPLLQRWFATTGHPSGKDPYFLYAASNAGSMLALLSYPFLLEPALPLDMQSAVWSIGYGVLAAGTVACAWLVQKQQQAEPAVLPATNGGTDQQVDTETEPAEEPAESQSVEVVEAESEANEHLDGGETAESPEEVRSEPEEPAGPLSTPVTPLRRLRWVALAFVPSAFMLAATTYISTDIAAIPLLWVVPLALYLLTFIIAFSSRQFPLVWAVRIQAVVIITLVLVVLVNEDSLPRTVAMGTPLLGLFMTSLVCHAQLALDRPSAKNLTEFYLWISVGGALGGIFTALIAPVMFDSLLEFPISIVLACLLMPSFSRKRLNSRREQVVLVLLPAAFLLGTVLLILGAQEWLPAIGRIVGITTALALCALFVLRPLRFGLALAAVLIGASLAAPNQSPVLFSDRTFFGVQEVLGDDDNRFHRLMHGTTLHGVQSMDPLTRLEPLSYYHRDTPVGRLLTELPIAGAPDIGVIGLGTGSLACYGREGQQWTFFEIDPVIERIARDPDLFTYLEDCPGEHDVVLGDARLSLQDEPDGKFGVLVVDAFNSDAIPVHLLTREALELYFDKVAPGGVVAIHISNRYLDLRPVLSNLSYDLGIAGLYAFNQQTLEHLRQGKSASHWVVLARSASDLEQLSVQTGWTRLVAEPGARVWTDDFSDVFSVFRWRTE
ncbi:MAG TPA: fused MFS/spermidine synthase [Actinomycetota bacterium]|nr:fused MFS/spermidine synthase [Actinomycetota bacterium]